MGKASRVFRDRRCKQCGRVMVATARDLQDHMKVCRIATKLGLTLPEPVQRPGGVILTDK